MRKVTIQVTEQDIEVGDRYRCEDCPVALAVNRVLKDGYRAEVDDLTIDIVGVNNVYRDTPEQARDFIIDFDDGDIVSPFSFELELPEEVLKEQSC